MRRRVGGIAGPIPNPNSTICNQLVIYLIVNGKHIDVISGRKQTKKITSPASANRSCQEAGAEGGVVYAIKLTPEDSVNPFVEAFVPGGKDNASRVEVQKKRDGSCYVALVTTDKDHENRGLASVLMAIALKVFRTSKSPYANLVNASGTNYMKRFEESGAPWTEKNCGEYTAGTRAYVTAFELAGYTLLATGTGGKKMGLDESRGAITTLQKQCEAKNLEWLANYEASFKNMYAFF